MISTGCRGIFALALLFLMAIAALAAPQAHPVQVVLASPAPAPVRFGISKLQQALKQRGYSSSITPVASHGPFQIVVRDPETSTPHTAANAAESYEIARTADNRIVIEGSDATGTMYGLLELAEEISASRGDDALREVKPSSGSPFLWIRGINMFLMTQDIDNPASSFWSDAYWHDFFDMMARDRYNFLDLHGPCDGVTLTFPNAYSYFIYLPDFPQVGVGEARAARNMARLRQIIQWAAERGVKVGYMNYEANPPIGPWQTRRFGIDERWTPVTQKFLTGPPVVTYTREAVASFLKQLPGLWMFGFRIGESGEPADFYKQTYLEALKAAPPDLKVYVRTWLADPEKIRELGRLTSHPLYIEPKYNGEHLGLPYQAVLGGRQYPPSGSYENYTDYPRDYSIIWQIRAHGTHHVFCWMGPEFARRTVKSCKFGDGAGFSMEQMSAYCPAEDYLHNNPAVQHRYYRWMFERYWMWYLVWGRTAYNPAVPDQVFINRFIGRFGPRAGPLIFKAMRENSRIVPFIYAYHNVGLDHQNFAPEFETGDHALGVRGRWWNGSRLVPYGGDNLDFLRVNTLDRTAMASPDVYVNDRLRGIPSGKLTPFEAAAYLDQAADASEEAIEDAARLAPTSGQEFDCLRMDIDAVAWLGRYYANRIVSATDLAFYMRTYDHPMLDQAYSHLSEAVSDWDRLAGIADTHFGHVPEYIRMGVKAFRWSDEGRNLGADLNQLDDLEAQFRRLPDEEWYRFMIGYVPPEKAIPGKPLRVTSTFVIASPGRQVSLFCKNANQSTYLEIPMTLASAHARTWTAEIPADEVVRGYLDLYFAGRSRHHFGTTLEHGAPYHILVNDDDSKPIISSHPHAGPVRGRQVTLTAQVHAKAKATSVWVYYKPMPSYVGWVRMTMQPQGDDLYSATVPLTPEGLLYYFEAVDADGNAANYPDFLKRTPYLVIQPWAPRDQ